MPTTIPGAPAPERSPGAVHGADLPFALPAECGGTVPALAAFALVLARHRGDDEVAVRVSTAAGSLPVRVDASAGLSAAAFTARVGESLAVALAARTLSGGAGNRGAGDRDRDRDRDRGAGDDGRTVLALDAGEEAGVAPNVALRIDTDEPLAGALEFDPRRVRPEEAARFLAHFGVVRRAMADEPGRAVVDLPLLTAEEREERVRWNATEADLPHGVLLHGAFEAHADARPRAVAIVHGGREITYGELEADANRLARHLRRRGVGPESRVGICVERGPRVVAAILGVLKAGGAYVPLDAAYPPERLAGMVRTAGIRVLVTEEGPGAALEMEGERILLDRDGGAIAAESVDRPDGGATPENLAYVIFTSGSTGEPKGIALAHRGVMNNLADLNARHGVGAADRVLLLSSLSFDMSVYETLGILAAGGAVVIPRADELRDPPAWAALCRRHSVTIWNSAPALLGMLCDHAEARPGDAPAGLRLAFLGGDWVPVPLVDRVRAWAPGMRDFIVMGGATEASIHSIIQPVGKVDPDWRSIPYGVPMANQRAYVLDRHLRHLPAGVAGELFLGGIGLARGYTGRAGFTAERFLPDPHGAPGARLYRTGDLARYGEDGTIELLGRIDHQVKIRGFRIEPGEIETALRRHPAVASAVVVSRADGGERRLVAYLVPAGDAALPEPRELRDLLRETLPDYMVPAAYVVLDRLPLSPNGKVDRRQLPAPPAEVERAPYVAPRTPAEAALAEIWGEVLGVERVGADDDFFALGGHSLAMARVAARVRERLGAGLALGELFRVPTLAEAAAAVAASSRGTGAAPIPRAAGDGPFPLAPAQRRLWLWEQMNPSRAAYNIPVALRLSGPVDAAVLERALDALVRRHEALRTAFATRDGEPVQRILPASPFTLPVEALPGSDAALRRRLAREGARAFDLAAGPLFRALLLRGEGEHVLMLTVHHLVCDGWSTQVMLRDLSALYAAFLRGEPSPLPEMPLRYGDFAAWHVRRLAEVENDQLAWWREHLAGAPGVLELPADRPRPAAQTHRGAQHFIRLPLDVVERARALGRDEGATLHMVLLAALYAVLARHARASEVVIGSAPAGRTHPDSEALVGFFVNTLPIRADLSADPGFRAFLRQVRTAALAAYDRQDVPFDRLVEALAPGGGRSHAPLVQVAFAYQDAPASGFALGAARAEPLWVELGTAQFDLTFLLDEDESGVSGVLEYATDLFDAATAERIAARLGVLLEAAVAAPDTRLSRLPLLRAGEREMLVAEWSGAGERFPAEGALHRRFEARAAADPNAAAVTFAGESLTYAALNARANRLARRLRALGAGPESRIGLCAERSTDLIAGVLAILKAGAAYVPLDPAYPAGRLAYMAEDSGIRILLAQPGLRDRVPVEGIEILSLDDAPTDELPDDLGIEVSADNLAYVIYTSGSTGRPKGVGVTHGNVLRLFSSTEASFGFGSDDVWTLFHSYAFDFSVWEIWGALLYGGRLVVVPWETSRDPSAFRALLRRERVTVLSQTPSAFRALAEVDAGEAEPLDALRAVVFGGEALRYESLRGWLDRYGPGRPRLVNMYGITETTVHVTWHTVTGEELREAGAGSTVGVPIPDLRAYVLDPVGSPSPIGIPGELHVGGAGLARGYLGRPGLTAERFVPDPLSGEAGARLYRSGDLARWRADGTLEYLGRIDQQVKVRGFRIEPGEIEAALLAQPGVASAAVVVRGEGDDTRLVAYVVPAGEGAPSASGLRDALKRHLPEHMVPAAFVEINRIPLTVNGKLDRKALPEPDEARGEGDGGFAAPRTPVEEMLAGIWAEVLRCERVGVTDDFFALGGHSLLATRVAARIPEVFGVELSVAAIFQAPTVAELAERVEALRRAGEPRLRPIVPVDRSGPLPLSFAQERLWFLQRMLPESAFYNITAVVRLSGALDAPALERALGEIVRRHEPLRTTFREVDGAPVQVISPFDGFRLPVEELSAFDDAEREAAAERRATEEAERPFDLAAGPLFRGVLLRLEPAEHVLLLSMHHIAVDEWGVEALFRELAAAYAAFREDRDPDLPELPVQYADYAAWQREQLVGDVLERRVAWWKERLAGAPALLELPTDHPRPALQSFRGATVHAALPAGLRARLEALGRGEGATLYMVLLAAFQALLARYSGSDDVVVGSPVAGQTRREVQELIGFFANTLALRADLSGDPSFRAALRRVREAALGAYQHQDVPFARLVAELQPGRSLSHSPLFQVAFALEDADRSRAELPGVRMRRSYAESATSKYDLTLYVAPREDGLRATIEYSTDLFERATVQRMLGHLERVLEQVAADADARLSALELAGDEERRLVVEEWNRTSADYPARACIHHLIEAQAERTPDAVAVVFEDESLPYRELNARANRLARRLARLGVGPEARVGLCLERSPEMVISVLAVLKAGGAYVPLDPGYPADRLEGMLDDAGISLLITQERLRDVIPARDGISLIVIDGQWGEIAIEDASNLDGRATASNLAYVIYTSGSTGRPKGVMNQHGSVVNRLCWMQAEYGLGADDVVLQKTPFSFDVSVWELFWPLQRGATLVMARPDGHRDPAYLQEVIERCGVTTLHFVPSMLQPFVETVDAGRCATLKRVVCSGEALPPALVERFHARFPSSVALHNLYGPTEAAVDVSHWTCERGASADVVPIGRPVWNTRLYVLDAMLRPLPVGVPGELYIGGVQVARGYLGRPGLTAERFVPDPFADDEGARLYRTGDRARWRADGALEYLGRLDHQVKIRGFRIEPGEIEAVLRRHPGVEEAAVAAYEHAPGDRRLAAYVVPHAGRAAAPRRLLEMERAGELAGYGVETLPDGTGVVSLNPHETAFLYEEIFARGAYLRHGITLPEDACVFDVGANIGLFTLRAARRAPRGRIYAFEPIPPVCGALRRNAAAHGGDVRVLECALGEAEGEAELTFYPHASILSGRHAEAAEDRAVVRRFLLNESDAGDDRAAEGLDALLDRRLTTERFPVRLRTLSGVIREEGVERIDLLKVDVEKAELEVLAGLEDDDWEKVRQVAMEVHDTAGRLREARALLESKGFVVVVEQDDALAGTALYDLYARRPDASTTVGDAIGIEIGSAGEIGTAGDDGPWRSSAWLMADLRRFVGARLPEFMVPSAFVTLAALPLGPAGKLDRRALPVPQAAPAEAAYTAPRNAVEEAVAGIFAEVLGRERAGAHDDFFALGGHSLLAMRAVARIQETLDGHVTVVTLFENPTVEALARLLSARADVAAASPAAGSGAGAEESPHALLAKLGQLSEEEVDRLLSESHGSFE